MRLYKPSYKSNGKTKKVAKWSIEFRGPDGIVRRFGLGIEDEFAAKDAKVILTTLNDCAKLHRDPPSEHAAWVRRQDPKLRAKIEKAGLVPAGQINQNKPLTEHLADYVSVLLARNNTEEYVANVESQARRIVNGCGFEFWADVEGSKITRYVSSIDRISNITKSKYILMFRQFIKWLLDDERIDKVVKIENIKYEKNPQRAFEPDEWRKLIKATREGPVRWNLTGYERYVIYTLAVETGLRLNELNSLAPESLRRELAKTRSGGKELADFVFVSGRNTKNGKDACQRITSETAAKVKGITKNKMPGVKLFTITSRAADMIRADAKVAGIELQNRDGKIKFHSLRHTCATFLIDQGVSPVEVQKIMRHAKIEMTLEIYAKRVKGREGEAIDLFKKLTA